MSKIKTHIKHSPKTVRKLIAQYEVLSEKEEEHSIHDLVKSWFDFLEPSEKVILNKYKSDKSQLSLQFDTHKRVFAKELAGSAVTQPAN